MQERQVTIEGDDAPARAAVHRARDAEPDRVRGHLPAARGAARPLPAAHRDRLPDARGRVADARAPRRAAARTRSSSSRSSTAPTLLAMQRALEQVHVSESDRPLHGRPRRGDADELARPGRRQPARHARAAQALARPRRARRPRLRHARRREGDRRARARPPADAAAGALGAADPRRGRRARVPRDRADAAGRGRRARAAAAPDDPARVAAARRVRGARRRSGCSRRSSSAGPELVVLAAPFALLLAVGLALGRAPASWRCRVALDAERALEGDEVPVDASIVVAGRRSSGSRSCSRCRTASRPTTAQNPVALRLAAGEERTLELSAALRALGRLRAGRDLPSARATGSALFAFGDRASTDARPLKVYPRPEQLLALLRPLETQVVRRQPGRAREGRRDRVRRPAAVRARRPRAPDQLARERPPRRARRQRAAPGAEHRRHPLPRQLRRGAGRRRSGTLDLAVRAAASLAERYLARKDRVGVVGFGGVLSWLLPATGLVQLYRIVDSLLDTEIVLNYAWKDIDVIPAADAAAEGARDRAHAAARRARGRRAARPARARLRPRGRRRLAGAVRRRRARTRRRSSRTGSGGSGARRCAYRFERAGVPVVEWHEGVPLAGALGGGVGIPAPRPRRARLVAGAGRCGRVRRCSRPIRRRVSTGDAAPRRRCSGAVRPRRARGLARDGLDERDRVDARAARREYAVVARPRAATPCSTPAAPLVGAGLLVLRRARVLVARAARARSRGGTRRASVASRRSPRSRSLSVAAGRLRRRGHGGPARRRPPLGRGRRARRGRRRSASWPASPGGPKRRRGRYNPAARRIRLVA